MSRQLNRREMIKSAGLGALAFSLGETSALGRSPLQAIPIGPKRYELPPLPYAYDALAPQIVKEVLKVHHDKHHAGYVKGLNATLDKLGQARAAGDFSQIKHLSRDLAFHGSGHVLHCLYWQSMTPKVEVRKAGPQGDLRKTLEHNFGSLESFRGQFLAAAKAVEGSGWAVLAFEPMGRRLVILQVEKHQNLTIWGAAPLLVCDVWEHAYYDQYQNRRGDYVDNFYELIDWRSVLVHYNEATAQIIAHVW